MKTTSIIAVLYFLTAVAMGATIYVPDDYTTIQGAIDAAIDGDTVIVRPGTYVENINFLGKKIRVQSERRAHLTIIDGSQLGSVVTFTSGETLDSILDGFTIRNGNSPNGGGIKCIGSRPKILHCIISKNGATVGDAVGGGIFSRESSPVVSGCMLFRNLARRAGGAMYCEGGSPIITGSTIVYNTHNGTTSGGGGISIVKDCSATVANTILWGNVAFAGNQIYIGSPTIPSNLDISYSDVEGGEALMYVDAGCTYTWGSGMIDSNPLFAGSSVPTINDYHLSYISPCQGAGDNNATGITLKDFEGDVRIEGVNVDMGADEFSPHLYSIGDVVPGGNIEIRVVGHPSINSVTLAQGSAIKDPPLWTAYGYIFIEQPFLGLWEIGPISNYGIKTLPVTVPAGSLPGDEFYLQALVGSKGGPITSLTNLMILIVK